MTMDNFGKHYTLNSEAPLYVGGKDLAQGEAVAGSHDGDLGGASVALWPKACQEGWCPGHWTVGVSQATGGLSFPAWSPG